MSVSINKVAHIARNAGRIILNVYHNKSHQVEFKKNNSPLTIADKLSSDYICSNLTKLYPDIPIICEETDNEDYDKRKDYTYVWLIDPLDGTKEFIKKTGEFTVNHSFQKYVSLVLLQSYRTHLGLYVYRFGYTHLERTAVSASLKDPLRRHAAIRPRTTRSRRQRGWRRRSRRGARGTPRSSS